MKSQHRISPGDVAACVPWLSFGVLLLFGFVAFLQVGHWPQYSRPDPKQLAFLGVRLDGFMYLSILLGAMAAFLSVGATGLAALMHTITDVADARWRFVSCRRYYARLAVSVLGCLLFCSQLSSMMDWLID